MSDWTGISGSAAYDVAACPPRVVLPKARKNGQYAERGNVLHDYCRKLGAHPSKRLAYLAALDEEYRLTAEGIDLGDALEGIEVKGREVAYILDVKNHTCRYIGENIERAYEEYLAENNLPPLTKYEIPFTIDVEGVSTVLGCPLELDYKTGMSIGDPFEHGQRRIAAAGLLFHHDVPLVVSRVAYIDEFGAVTPDGCDFTMLDAIETCDKMVRAIDAVARVREQVARGETPTVYPDRDKQCKYCDSFVYCPYWSSLLSTTAATLQAQGISGEPGSVMKFVKDLIKVATELEDQLKERAKREPLIVDDENEYRAEWRDGRKYFDNAAARGLIIQLAGRLGEDEKQIEQRLAGLNKQGKSYQEVRKRKRELPVIRKAG